MTYHFGSKSTGGGLGAYTGYNTGPLGKELVARNGATDSSSLKAYASISAGAGGAALCTAYGGAAVAPLCAQAASAIADVIIGSIGQPTTTSKSYTLVHEWNERILPQIRAATEGQLAIRGYLAMRDQAIDDAAKTGVTSAWADKWLTDKGIPGAPILAQWAPRQDLYEAYKSIAIWAQNPINYAPHLRSISWLPPKGSTNFCSTNAISRHQDGPSAQLVAGQIGMSCPEFLTTFYYPFGPMAAPGEPINWGMVGAWQVVARFLKAPAGKTGYYWPDVCIGIPMLNVSPHASGNISVCKGPPKNPLPSEMVQATVIPSQLAAELSFKLQDAKPKLLADAKKLGTLSSLVLVKTEPKKSKSGASVVAVVAAGLGVGGWWWWKRRR